MTNRNCLSYWFPKLSAAGVPVPRTEIVRTTCNLSPLLDNNTPDGWEDFLAELNAAIRKLTDAANPTPPVFLRTGQGSGKHNWKRTCHLTDATKIGHHVAALVEWSEMVDFLGLPWNVWVVREMLPVDPVAVLPAYGDMPLVKEVRCFVRGGEVICCHPYWPQLAVADGFGMPRDRTDGRVKGAGDSTRLADAVARSTPNADDKEQWMPLAERVAVAFADDGAWSVDLLATRKGWAVTDMAEAGRSFHWDGCPKAKEFQP